MKRASLVAAVSGLVFASANATVQDADRCAGREAPDCLLELERIADRTTLGLAVGQPSTLSVGSDVVTVVDLQFEDARWKGAAWPHRVQVFFPGGKTAFESAAIYAELTPEGALLPNAAIVDAFGARTALATGVPVAIVGDVPPQPIRLEGVALPALAPCFDEAGDETRWMECAMRAANETGDSSWSPFVALASSYLRAAVALQAAGDVLEARGTKGFHPARFAIGGYSKRGNAMWIAAAARGPGLPAIAGAWIGGSVFPDQPGLAARSRAQLGDAGGKWKTASAFYDTDAGRRWLERNDPLSWRSRYEDVALSMVRGSDDELWPRGEAKPLLAAFPTLRIAYLADARHVDRAGAERYTLTSPEVVGSWRSLVRRALLGERPLDVTVAVEKKRLAVTAPDASRSAAARLWWTAGAGRDPSWTAVDLARKKDGSWSGSLPKGASRWIVDVRDGDRFATSAMPE